MKEAAANLEFEVAAMLRDQVNELRALDAPDVRAAPGRPRPDAQAHDPPRASAEPELGQRRREALGRTSPPGPVLAFEGELGAGKTTFVQALGTRAGRRQPATSPTYALVHRYKGRRGPVFHLDCYRLQHPEEARRSRLGGAGRRRRRDPGRVAGAGRRAGCRLPTQPLSASPSAGCRHGAGWRSSSDVAGDRYRHRPSLGRARRSRLGRWRRRPSRCPAPRGELLPAIETCLRRRGLGVRRAWRDRAGRWSRELHRAPGRRRSRQGAGPGADRMPLWIAPSLLVAAAGAGAAPGDTCAGGQRCAAG